MNAPQVFHGGEAVAELKHHRADDSDDARTRFSTAVKPWPN